MYLISVYFDEETNKILNRHIDKIARVTGNDFMTSHKVPPHMTIAQIEARGEEVLVEPMESLKGRLKSGEIQIVSLGMLLPYVLYGGVLPGDYIMGLSQNVYMNFQGIPETSISKYTTPGLWLPHITLGKTLTKPQMQAAIGAMIDGFSPIKGRVTKIGLAKVNPHRDVLMFDLE